MENKRNHALIQTAPIAIVLAAWLPQVGYRLLVQNTPFSDVASAVYGLVALAVFCYVCGAFVGRKADGVYLLLRAEAPLNTLARVGSIGTTGFYKKFRLIVVILALTFFLNSFLIQILNGVDMAALRDDALSEWSEGGVLVKLMAVGVNSLACLLLLFISLEHRSRRKVNLPLVLLFVFICLAAYARTLLLIGLFILMTRLVADNGAPVKLVVKLVSGFIMLFLLLAVFGKAHSEDSGGVTEIVLRHGEVYFFGGVAGLNNFLTYGEPHYNTLLSIPRFIQGLLPINEEAPPQYFDFVETPQPLNVYTAIYPPFHDFGVAGVVVLFFFYGTVTSAACRKFSMTDSYVWQVVAGFLLYATAMSIFDDQFIRALPVFLIFFTTAVFFNVLRPFFESPIRTV